MTRLLALVGVTALGWLAPAVAGDESEELTSERQRNLEGAIEGYQPEQRQVGGPTDVETDLNSAFPEKDSLFPGIFPKRWFELKEELYENTGIKLAVSYQALFQRATDTLTPGLGTDSAAAGWFLLEIKWEVINRGEDYQGSLVFDLDWRHTLGENANPALFGTFAVGSLWPTDVAFFDWDPSFAVAYWDQWFKKDVLNVRVGKQLAAYTYDFFRFKDTRTSFSGTPFAAHTSIPAPAFGQALFFKWWPVEGSSLYVLGTLNDMNGDPTRIGFDTFFEKHQFFYGLEIGYFWKRGQADFDHVHLDIFYADKKDTQPPGLPNKAGGGFKLLGSKQWNRVVGFGSYTYNTAEGGGLGATFGRHTVTAGLAMLKPLGVQGEIGLGLAWMHPLDSTLRDQYGGELYWKLLLTPDFWLTPGLQFIWDPSFNPAEDFVAVFQIKFRLFF